MPTAFDAGRAVSLVFVSKLNGTVDSMVFQQQQQDEVGCNGFQFSCSGLAAVPNQQASLLPLSF